MSAPRSASATLALLVACAPAGTEPPARPTATAPTAAPPPAASDAPVVASSDAAAADAAGDDDGGPVALAHVEIEAAYALDSGTRRKRLTSYQPAVTACFDSIPVDQRRPELIYEVRLQWTLAPAGGGEPVRAGGTDGVELDPSRGSDRRFTGCVTTALPRRLVDAEPDRARIRSATITVRAFTRSAARRWRGGGTPGSP